MKKRTGYLAKRGRIYYAVWTVAGKKFMQTTGKGDRREAETELRRIMEPFAAAEEVDILRNIATKIEGRTAELSRLEDERNPPTSLVAAWSAYLASANRPDSGPVTLRQYDGHFRQFADWMKRMHPEAPALRDMTPAIAGEYAAHLSAERKLSANRVNKNVRFLQLLFRVLKGPSRLDANPWEAIQRKRVISDSRRELTMEELKAVCKAAAGEMRLLFAVGIYTGLRLGDCATLRWAEVDLQRQFIRRIPNKTARRNPRPITIPIHPVLLAMLSEVPHEGRGEYVLPESAATYLSDTSMISRHIQDHFKACGFRTQRLGTGKASLAKDPETDKPIRGTGKRAVVEVGFHSLRHTFVSLCRESNAPLSVVEAIVGHSNPAMTRHYTHVSEMAATSAVNALPAVMGDTGVLPPERSRDDKMREIVEGMTAKTLKADRARLLEILKPANGKHELPASTQS